MQENEKIKIGNYEYRLSDLVGQGSFGKVYLGHHLETKRPVAIKSFAKDKLKKKSLFRSLKNEIDTLKRIKHENVVEFLEIVIGEKEVFMIMEYCNQKDLKHYLKVHKMLTEEVAVGFLKQIISAFKELCRKHIIHRDLKPANLLLHENKLKIADFGFARFVEEDVTNYEKQHVSIVGTPLYMSPQLLARERYTTKSDIWSIGIIFYEMLFGKVPWVAKDPQSYLKNILAMPPPIDRKINNISIEAEDFIVHCLRVNESERMGWEEMFSHSLVNGESGAKNDETGAEFFNEEPNLESKIRIYNSQGISGPAKLIKSAYEETRKMKINYLKVQEFTPFSLTGSQRSKSNDKNLMSAKLGWSQNNSVSMQGNSVGGNALSLHFGKAGKNGEESKKISNSAFHDELMKDNADSDTKNMKNAGDTTKVTKAKSDDTYIDPINAPTNFMSYELKGNYDFKELEIVITKCRAIELKCWDFLMVVEENALLFRLGTSEKYRLCLLLVKFICLFVEQITGTFKSILESHTVKFLEDPSKTRKIRKVLELIERDYNVMKEIETSNRRSLLTLGNDPLMDEKEKDNLLKFFVKYSNCTSPKEIENELTKCLAKACSIFKELILKKKLDLMLKNHKKKQYLVFFHGLSLFFQGDIFNYMSDWRPDAKFEMDQRDLRAESFAEDTVLEMLRESYSKVIKYLEGTEV